MNKSTDSPRREVHRLHKQKMLYIISRFTVDFIQENITDPDKIVEFVENWVESHFVAEPVIEWKPGEQSMEEMVEIAKRKSKNCKIIKLN